MSRTEDDLICVAGKPVFVSESAGDLVPVVRLPQRVHPTEIRNRAETM
jgi:hypothetical protein